LQNQRQARFTCTPRQISLSERIAKTFPTISIWIINSDRSTGGPWTNNEEQLDRKVLKLARHHAQVRRFMTAPGVGPITALAFKATIDDPTRFERSRSVGVYAG
jgi:transposase